MKGLKKVLLAIKSFFLTLARWFDKTIIVPITKFFMMFTEKTGTNSGKFERWLTKKNTLVFISLILAIGLFFVVDNKSVVLVDSSAEVFKNRPKTAENGLFVIKCEHVPFPQ